MSDAKISQKILNDLIESNKFFYFIVANELGSPGVILGIYHAAPTSESKSCKKIINDFGTQKNLIVLKSKWTYGKLPDFNSGYDAKIIDWDIIKDKAGI